LSHLGQLSKEVLVVIAIIAALVAALFSTPVAASTGVEFDGPSPADAGEGTVVEFPSPAEPAGEGVDIPLPEQGEEEALAPSAGAAPPEAGQATLPEREKSAGSPVPTAVGAAGMRPHQRAHRAGGALPVIQPGASLGVSRHRAIWREAHEAGVVSRSWVEARIRATQAGAAPAAVQNQGALPQRASAGADAPRKGVVPDMGTIVIAIIAILAAMAVAVAAVIAATRADDLPAPGEVIAALPGGLVVEASGWAGGRGWRVSSAPAPPTPGAARAGTARAVINPEELGS